MPHTKHLRRLLGVFAFVTAGMLLNVIAPLPSLQARVIERKEKSVTSWKTLTEFDVGSGSTVLTGTHTFFSVPVEVDTIGREMLLGQRGFQVRYWGYCFADENDPENPPQSTGFPGKIFLSEAERQWRKNEETRQNAFSPFLHPSLQPARAASRSLIRHQIDTFRGGMTCYIMSQDNLPIGIDADDDGLNSQLEKKYNTDAAKADTEEDGLNDGAEIRYGTDPLRRDTDGDGVIDGLEDANHNGRFDAGETDPRARDSDGDLLCDGSCPEFKVRKICKDNKGNQCIDVPYGLTMGEDKNINGKVDTGETDPRKADSLGDGIRDDQRVYKCMLEGGKNC